MAKLCRLHMVLPPEHSEEEAETLQAFLALKVAHGWEETSLPTGEFCCVVHSATPDLCDELMRFLPAVLPAVRLKADAAEDVNWLEAWKEFFTPVEAGRLFLVLAPWMEKEKAETSRIPIVIEPKNAFGTGHHATTALCLEAVSSLHDDGTLRPGMRFLDLGMGSGILGIACAKLGLKGDGLDIDAASVANAEENREINGVAAKDFQLFLGSVEKAVGPYDVVLANILAQPLKEMAPQIASLQSPDGKPSLLVLAGMLEIQADAVERAYTDCGRLPARRLRQGEWTALVFEDGFRDGISG